MTTHNHMTSREGLWTIEFKKNCQKISPFVIFNREDCTEAVLSTFLHSGFLADQKWFISVLYHLVNHQILNWMQKPKFKLEVIIFLEFWVVFIVSSFVGNHVSYMKINYTFDIWLELLKLYRNQLDKPSDNLQQHDMVDIRKKITIEKQGIK